MKDDHHLILYLILYLIYREKTVYLKTHKTAINRAVDYTLTSCLEGLETAKWSNHRETDR